ncbi:MAG: ABC transporter ATP-binding protein, partial [Burkholderiales bacterium]|nr:ABC transporter ATP-binding protein [Burkholderiales bacterium]
AFARTWFDAVKQVDLRIETGETLGLVGESGSGKSTLAKVCLGLLRPSQGRARLEDEDLFGIGRRRPGSLAAVLQHPEWSLNPKLSIGRSIAEPLGVAGVRGAEAANRVAQMLDKVGLNAAYAKRLPHELSGGQRQRASIARALATMPRFIVFDEAVSALDVSIQAQILNLLKALQQEFRFAALFISHDLGAVRYVSHQVVVLKQGVVQERAPARAFYEPMANPYVRQLQTDSGLI